MPFVVYPLLWCAIFAALAWAVGDHRRAGGLAAILVALPVAFFTYNGLSAPANLHAMILLWLAAPVALYFQGLIRFAPAITGEFIALPYLLSWWGLLDPQAALWWGDFFGLSMLALITGPLIGQLVGMALAWIALHSGGRDLGLRASRDSAPPPEPGTQGGR